METCRTCHWGPCNKGWERCYGLDEDLEGLTGMTTDWYPDRVVNVDETVSIEHARDDEFRIKEWIDNQQDMENLGVESPKTKGLPICRLVRGSRI